jgi:hypothetical protein
VKRLLAAAAALLGIAYFKRKRPGQADPADELRAKLAQARDADDRDEFEAGETPVDEAPDPDERRRAVHEDARRTIDELRDQS